MRKVVHLVGEMCDEVQICRRCGVVVLDYRRTVCFPPSTEPLRGFAAGPVTAIGRGIVVGAEPDGVFCEPALGAPTSSAMIN